MKGVESAAEPIAKKTKMEDPPVSTPQGSTQLCSAVDDEKYFLLAKLLSIVMVFFIFILQY
jgi:hypothetical protein